MNILIICKALEDSYKGGIQTHVTCLSSELVSLGHKVTVLTTSQIKTSEDYNRDGITVIKLPYIPKKCAFGFTHILGELSFNLAVRYWVNKHCKHYDIIHIQGRSGLMIDVKGISVPVVTTIHRLMKVEQKWNKSEYSNFIDRYLHRKWAIHYENKILKTGGAIITVSHACKEEILDLDINMDIKLNVIPNGVEIPEPKNITESNSILFVGRLSKVKGLPILLKSMKHVNNSIQLNIVGIGPEQQNIIDLIKELNLAERVHLLGSQPRRVIGQLMSESKALVLPSYHESQGVVILEANAIGIPVIASDNSGIAQIVTHGKNGLLFKTGQVTELAKTIDLLTNKPKLAAQMGTTGRALMKEKFDWKKITHSIIGIYKNVA